MSTILQISDLHLLSTPDGTLRGVPTFESARLVMERARREVADPASVVLTGDLSHEHSVAGYRLVEDLLGPWGERSLLIPGNHDDRHGLRTVFAQAPGEGDDDVGFCSHLGNWRLIGLDTQIPDEIPGELSDSMLEQLEAWLTEDEHRPTLIFMHHPPISVNTPWLDAMGLGNPAALEAIVRKHPCVRGVFCGHIHQVFEGEFAGVPVHGTPAAAFQFLPGAESPVFDPIPPGFRVIQLKDDTFQTRVVRLDTAPFVVR